MRFPQLRSRHRLLLAICLFIAGAHAAAAQDRFNGARALSYTQEFVNGTGPRWVGSEGHARAEDYIKKQFAKDNPEQDSFVAFTPAGAQQMHNYIVRFPGKKDGVIVVATHYETNYYLRDIQYVGANDGGATTGLLIELANHLRGRTLDGYSVWLVFFDGEESVSGQWSRSDSTYGSRHLAAKWQTDGTLKRIKAFLLADMIGDKDLNIQRDSNSTPWLLDLVGQAAKHLGYQAHFFRTEGAIEDDHLPFVQRGVPCADIIDIDYGPHSTAFPDGYHHTAMDTLSMVSAHSLGISGDTILETIRLLNQR